ncbi:MAG TPA: hypothetical protein VF814_16305 [Casimicrobiaceae bacterium]
MVKMITLAEAAANKDLSVRRLQTLCKQRRIPGARLVGRSWFVPPDFEISRGVPGRPPLDTRDAARQRLILTFQDIIGDVREADSVDGRLDAIAQNLPAVERLITEIDDQVANLAWEIMFHLTRHRHR